MVKTGLGTTLLPHCKIDFFVYTPEEFEEMEKGNHFVQSIVRGSYFERKGDKLCENKI